MGDLAAPRALQVVILTTVVAIAAALPWLAHKDPKRGDLT
jgi:hypothetical protein